MGVHAAFPSLKMPLFASGTAVLSKFPTYQSKEFTFQRVLPIPRKGLFFTRAFVHPGGPADYKYLNVVSAHCTDIDWTFRHPRLTQQRHISRVIGFQEQAGNTGRLVVAGDFNEEWTTHTQILKRLADERGLQAFQPENKALCTYPSSRPAERLDWILISRDCRFLDYRVLPEIVSDHLAVFARISVPLKRKEEVPQSAQR